jgi:hypothetical protein
MHNENEVTFAVDRIEGDLAVLSGDDGVQVEALLELLPPGLSEGMVLGVALGTSGEPDWETARIDAAEAGARQKRASEILDELKKRDPGGDIKM